MMAVKGLLMANNTDLRQSIVKGSTGPTRQGWRNYPVNIAIIFLIGVLVVSLLVALVYLHMPASKSSSTTKQRVSVAQKKATATAIPHITRPAYTGPFTNTWTNIHSFLTFDYKIEDSSAVAQKYDFVWGANYKNLAAYRAANPHIVLSYYFPMHRNHGDFIDTALGKQQGLDYWRALHPDWVLYKCDRTTPAYEYYDPNMPFILTDPTILHWMVQSFAAPAAQYGYDAVALDNVNMDNMFGACGSYDKNGQWVQRYTGKTNDPQWQADVANWMAEMQEALRHLSKPLLLIPNLDPGSVAIDSASIQKVLTNSDGVLDESSFSHYGENNLSSGQWLQLVHYVNAVQAQNKPFFLVNEFQKDIANKDKEWVLASYLMCKQQVSMIYFALYQAYGRDMQIPELDAQIGSPQTQMYEKQGAYWRDYTNGETLVNPTDTPATIKTDATTAYVDIFGQSISQTFTLSPHTGKILLLKSH